MLLSVFTLRYKVVRKWARVLIAPLAGATIFGVGFRLTDEVMVIGWTASDKNLKPEPVDLYYSTRKEGPWVPIAKCVKNDGNYRWQMPAGMQGEIFVRIDVTDRAGNTTHCEASQAAFMDLARPKARVIGVAAPRACATPGN